jgi:hypothetical protein
MLFPLACIVIATPALAQNAYETHTARYRCVVLGDTPSCERTVPATLTRIEERLEPGPRARYLMFLGADKAQAIEMARTSGEDPTRSVVRITRRSFSSREAYDQSWARRTSRSSRSRRSTAQWIELMARRRARIS